MAMKDEPKKTLAPKLRFPKFKDQWQPATIGDLFDSEDDRERATTFESDKILTVKLHANGVVRNERTGALTGGASYFKRRAGQFIFSKIDLLSGAFGIVPKDLDGFYSSSDVPAFSFGDQHSPAFFVYWLAANFRRLKIERTGTSATLKRVSPEKFRALPILLPSPAEQRQIAACLTSLDELVSAEGRKLEALRAHKKGLMQQLFPRQGESRPQLRFPEFRDAEEWAAAKLSKIVDLISGVHLAPNEYATDGEIPYFTGPSDFSNDATSVPKWTVSSSNAAKKGDTLVTVKGSGVGELLFLELPIVAMGRQLMAARPKTSAKRFVLFLLETKRQQFEDRASGNLIPGLSRGDILDLESPLPKDEFEQQRIADCLGSLDALIAAASRKLDGLRVHKKSLMQRLFPPPEGD